MIDVFPPHQQQQIRVQLSMGLIGVMSQQLLPRASGTGRALAMEVMVPNAAIRNLIREDKLHQIYSQMQVGQSGTVRVTILPGQGGYVGSTRKGVTRNGYAQYPSSFRVHR